MNHVDPQYQNLLQHILDNGVPQNDRTGVGTLDTFGGQLRFDLSKGFPLLTTKKLHTRSIFIELLWFLKGDTNIKYLKDNGVSIWDEWADEDGDLGPIYGAQWRNWNSEWAEANGVGYDQITELIKLIKKDPASRRQIVTAWNPSDLNSVALSWCHCLFQTHVANGKLSLHLYQRSCDTFLGLPFNIASYALLTHILAQQCDLEVGDFIWSGGSVHLYSNHLDQAREQITRGPRALPTLKILRKPDSFEDYKIEDFVIEGYDPHPHIKAEVAV